MPRILGVGTLLLDILSCVDDSFLVQNVPGRKGGSDTVTADFSRSLAVKLPGVKYAPGGSAPNTLDALAAWGIDSRLIGMVGRDEDGDYCKQHFRGDISAIKTHPELPTGRCISMVTPDSERTMRTFLGASAAIAPEDLQEQDFAGVDLLLFEGYMLYDEPLTLKIFEIAERLAIPVAFDLASFELVAKYRESLLPDLLKKCAVLFCNREEAEAFAGQGSNEELLDRLSVFAPLVALKLGRDGAMILQNGKTISVEAELVENPVDTTGAGDLWQAGFLYGHLTGKSLETCGNLGAALGAEVVSVLGGVIPEEGWQRIIKKFNLK
ncbi:MAG: adenosine kinase [Lentisphaeria bacterium]|nr:adenosine kinase [Lentisphaeria bacterium]